MSATDLGTATEPELRPTTPGGPSAVALPATTQVHVARVSDNRVARAIWLAFGSLALGLGIIGIVVPGWPTTIFVILAASCYARSSQRLYDRVLANRFIGRHARTFRETGAMPRRAKTIALAVMWPFVGFSVLVAIPDSLLWARLAVVLFALAGTAYILWLPAAPPSD